MLEGDRFFETIRHCLVRENQLSMKRGQILVWVNIKELEKLLFDSYDETSINSESEKVAQDTFQGNFFSPEDENNGYQIFEVCVDEQALNSSSTSDDCTSDQNMEDIEASQPPLQRCNRVRRLPARFRIWPWQLFMTRWQMRKP